MILKTLKDLEKPIGCYSGCEIGNTLVLDKSELRQEAINWIRECYCFKKDPEDEAWEFITGKKCIYSEDGKQAIINFIKYFFNITEEEMR